MLKKEGNMARRWFLIDEKVRFVIAGIVNMAIRYLIFVLLGLAFSVSRYQLVLLATLAVVFGDCLFFVQAPGFSYRGQSFERICQITPDLVFELCPECGFVGSSCREAGMERLFGAGGSDRFDRGSQLSFVQTFCLPPTKEESA